MGLVEDEKIWEPEGDIYWGPETELRLKKDIQRQELDNPLGAVQNGLNICKSRRTKWKTRSNCFG